MFNLIFKASEQPKNQDTLGVLGYLVVANKQVHSYQIDVLNDYLSSIDLSLNESVLNDIIIGSEETALSFASSLTAFETESATVQSEIIFVTYILAYIDNSFDSNELDIINALVSSSVLSTIEIEKTKENAKSEALLYRSYNNVLFSRTRNDEKQSIIKRFWNWLLSLLKKVLHISNDNTVFDENSAYRYMIEKCEKTAKEDFSVVKPSYEKVLDACAKTITKIQQYKNSISSETELSEEISKAVGLFVDKLNRDVLEQTKEAQNSLAQKERTVSDFTISLLGRTKAGKSTLHAVLTNQGKESIGIGKQRTTRYNRVYQWNCLRIIDTPGIGSSEAGGRSDEEIAASVLGETDIICFVIVDDSILKDILEFIERISLLNKPIIVLLNHKENIKPEVKFNRFIANPTEWLYTNGESNLQGHIDRIKKYAQTKGFDNLISVFPVFLLPALMSTESEYVKYSDLLWNSSNVDVFIKQLKEWISKGGSIKRSQTILDEASVNFGRANEQILMAEEILVDRIDNLQKQRKKKDAKLRDLGEIVKTKIRKLLEEKYKDLATTYALDFAEEEYCKSGNVSKDWQSYLTRIEFTKDVNDEIEKEFKVFTNEIDDIVSELFEDYYFSIKGSFETLKADIPFEINLRAIARLGGAALGVAGSIVLAILGISNPVGWVLTLAGTAIGLLANLFKSKEKKRQEAINKVYNAVHDSVMGCMKSEIEQTIQKVDNVIQSSIEKVDRLFSDLISGLNKTYEWSRELRNTFIEQQKWLNKVYGWRLFQYLTNKNDSFNLDLINSDILDVDRSIPGEITISIQTDEQINPDILNNIIVEQIKVVRRL